jgi:hypothetical protein
MIFEGVTFTTKDYLRSSLAISAIGAGIAHRDASLNGCSIPENTTSAEVFLVFYSLSKLLTLDDQNGHRICQKDSNAT